MNFLWLFPALGRFCDFLIRSITDDLCRHADGSRVVGYVVCDHAACADDASFADADTGTDDDTAAKPRVVADADGVACLTCAASFQMVFRVLWCVELAVGANFNVVSDGDGGTVEDGTVVVDERVLAHVDSVAVVAEEWRTDLCRLRNARNELLERLAVARGGDGEAVQAQAHLLGMP